MKITIKFLFAAKMKLRSKRSDRWPSLLFDQSFSLTYSSKSTIVTLFCRRIHLITALINLGQNIIPFYTYCEDNHSLPHKKLLDRREKRLFLLFVIFIARLLHQNYFHLFVLTWKFDDFPKKRKDKNNCFREIAFDILLLGGGTPIWKGWRC